MSRDPSELPFLERLQVDGVFRAEVDAQAVEDMTPRRSEDVYDLEDRIDRIASTLRYWAAHHRPMRGYEPEEARGALQRIARVMPEISEQYYRMRDERNELARQLKERENADRPTA